MEVSKRKFRIIIILLVIIALIPPSLIMKEVIYYKLLAKDTQQKISQIDASELETKLIEELQKTKLNINNSSFSTSFAVCDSDNLDNETAYLTLYYDLLKAKYPTITNPYEGYVLACIVENKSLPERVYIPCFKIESNNEGKVENIIYAWHGYFGVGDEVESIVNNVFNQQYNVKSHSLESVAYFRDKYSKFPFGSRNRYYGAYRDREIYYTDNDFAAKVLSKICNNAGYIINESEVKSDLRNDKIKISFNIWK